MHLKIFSREKHETPPPYWMKYLVRQLNTHLPRLLVISHRGLKKFWDVEEDRADDDGDEVLGHAGVLVLHQTSVAVLLKRFVSRFWLFFIVCMICNNCSATGCNNCNIRIIGFVLQSYLRTRGDIPWVCRRPSSAPP